MGVHGLTSFIKKQTSLATTVSLPDPSLGDARISWIVDGLAALYFLGLVDPLRGGNYATVRSNVRRYIEWWRACGLEPEFVWDGPFDAAKLPTVIQRSSQSLARSLTYMRASDQARATPNLRNQAARLPPLTHIAVAAELEALGVTCHCAEEEADSPTAELAERRNGFVVSNDSDYFIYNARCRGYVPLSAIEYGPFNQTRLEQIAPTTTPSMRLRVYRHETIARSLSLPPSFLPIFAALVGNDLVDYSREICLPRHAKPAFPGQVEPQELLRIARALSHFAHLPADCLAQIQDIVFAVLPTLLQKPSKDPLIVANLADSAHAYVLRSLDLPSPSYPLRPHSTDSPAQAQCRALYHAAYKSSKLSSFVLHTIKHGTVVIQGSVEMPEYQSPVVSLGRPIRLWIYAVLKECVGLPYPTITEYARRQDALHAAEVPVPSLSSLVPSLPPAPVPILLQPLSARLSLFLTALSYPPSLPPHPPPSPFAPFFPLVLALRHIQHLSKRPWTPHEVRSALLVAALLLLAPGALPALASSSESLARVPRKEHMQRSVELVQALVWINTLAQVLGLAEVVPQPSGLFDGAALHALLGLGEESVGRVLEGLPEEVQGVVKGLEEMVLRTE
ncbi:hypothetical protein JCM1840_004618 [Sporobolomyces johnsonii]